MIHDATVEVTCDGEHCQENVRVEPEYVYMNFAGGGGHYDTSDSAIEKRLPREDWLVIDGKHYCDSGCVPGEGSEA